MEKYFQIACANTVILATKKEKSWIQGSRQDFSSKGRKICILIYIFHLISITIEKHVNQPLLVRCFILVIPGFSIPAFSFLG